MGLRRRSAGDDLAGLTPAGDDTAPSDGAYVRLAPVVVGRPSPPIEPVPTHERYQVTSGRSDTVIDGWSVGMLTVRAASVRGGLNRADGTPRQDDVTVAGRRTGHVLVAIADGVSSAEQSHLGAATAVRYAVQWLDTSLADPVPETDWTSLVASTAWALVDKATTALGIDEDPKQAERLLATTLLCAVIESRPNGGAVAHLVTVGDSGAWLITGDRIIRVLGAKETQEGVTSSAVVGLPRVPPDVQPLLVEMGPGDVLLLGTDGIGDALGSGEGEVGQLLRSLVGTRVPSLTEFAHYLDFSRETFDDDRTLVAVWAGANASKPMP